MRIGMTVAEARRRAAASYAGDSKPLVSVPKGDAAEALSVLWWLSAPKVEGADSARHRAALGLYIDLGRESAHDLGDYAFPAVFDLEGGAMRPDKGAIEAFFDNGLIKAWMMGAQLVFELTETGRANLNETTN